MFGARCLRAGMSCRMLVLPLCAVSSSTLRTISSSSTSSYRGNTIMLNGLGSVKSKHAAYPRWKIGCLSWTKSAARFFKFAKLKCPLLFTKAQVAAPPAVMKEDPGSILGKTEIFLHLKPFNGEMNKKVKNNNNSCNSLVFGSMAVKMQITVSGTSAPNHYA